MKNILFIILCFGLFAGCKPLEIVPQSTVYVFKSEFATWFNFALHSLSIILFISALVKIDFLFIKARVRDVRAVLTSDIKKYEQINSIIIILKVIASSACLCISISRIRQNAIFFSVGDLVFWMVLSISFFSVALLDYIKSSPENE